MPLYCTHLFICALWSPAGKELTSWLSFIGILGQVWYLIIYRFLIFAPLLTCICRFRMISFLPCDDFDFEIVNFPFVDGDVPSSTFYGVYIFQLIRFARASTYVTDFNTRNKLLTQKLLKQGCRYHKLRKTFSKFHRRYYYLISKFQVGLKSLLRQRLLWRLGV